MKRAYLVVALSRLKKAGKITGDPSGWGLPAVPPELWQARLTSNTPEML